MGRQASDFSPLLSTPSLPFHIVGRGQAQVEPLFLPGLGSVELEEVDLMNGPTLLTIDCWQMSKAVWIRS